MSVGNKTRNNESIVIIYLSIYICIVKKIAMFGYQCMLQV